MAVKVAATPFLNWSPKNKQLNDVVSASRTTWLGTTSSKLSRTRSFELKPNQRLSHSIRRTCSSSFDTNFSGDEEFSRKIQELALLFQFTDENSTDSDSIESASEVIRTDSPDWNLASIEMKANSVNLPISLRMIKRKKNQFKKNISECGEKTYCSVKKAFSSMVFIIRELHSQCLQMREILFYEDLQGILSRVENEMHASFVWLFQQVFSHTPTLMIYVMILLANFTVHSMSNSAAFATVSPPPIVATVEESDSGNIITSVSVVSTWTGSMTNSGGGGSGGGNNVKPVASGMHGDGWMNDSVARINRSIVSDGVSPFRTEEESVSGQDETLAWDSILDEARRMQGQIKDECLDDEVTRLFVSPVTTKIKEENYEDYFKTELAYQTEIGQEPNNVLLLANYAQFLYLVVHDFDRAEEYFKRATSVEPKDAESHSKYAHFLWQARNDLWASEETYLEAISADPANSFYAANYAHFLWNTGGEDTCFPLDDDTPEDETLDA